MEARIIETDGLEELIARLWASGATGRDRVGALLTAIETVAPAAIDRAHARRVGRQLRLSETPAG